MANFLTEGREALIERMQANATLAREIRNWFVFSSTLQTRLIVEPAQCPFCSIAPAEGQIELISDPMADIDQVLQIDFGVRGQDCAPMEELLVAFYDVVLDALTDHLGLAEEGLALVLLEGGPTWMARQDKEGADFIWITTSNLRLGWKRLRPLSS